MRKKDVSQQKHLNNHYMFKLEHRKFTTAQKGILFVSQESGLRRENGPFK